MRRGFTLIEALIAVALGLTICYAAFACVQMCNQAATTATRLSSENRLLRAGYLAALDELDFWNSYDDPSDPARQPLRGAGHPFHPLAFVGDLAPSTDQSAGDACWRGLPIRNDPEAPKYGRYELVASSDPAAPFHRQARFIERVYGDLGFYGLFDYAPANTIFSYADADGATPETWWRYVGSPGFLAANDGLSRPKDYYGCTHGGAFVVTTEAGFLAAGSDHARFGFWAWPGVAGDPWNYSGFLGTVDHQTVLPLRPAHWPQVDVVVRHLAAMFRKTGSVSVTVASPDTGSTLKMAWTMTSTTLRGARRQRAAGLGWARPGQPTLDD